MIRARNREKSLSYLGTKTTPHRKKKNRKNYSVFPWNPSGRLNSILCMPLPIRPPQVLLPPVEDNDGVWGLSADKQARNEVKDLKICSTAVGGHIAEAKRRIRSRLVAHVDKTDSARRCFELAFEAVIHASQSEDARVQAHGGKLAAKLLELVEVFTRDNDARRPTTALSVYGGINVDQRTLSSPILDRLRSITGGRLSKESESESGAGADAESSPPSYPGLSLEPEFALELEPKPEPGEADA